MTNVTAAATNTLATDVSFSTSATSASTTANRDIGCRGHYKPLHPTPFSS